MSKKIIFLLRESHSFQMLIKLIDTNQIKNLFWITAGILMTGF